MEFLVLLGTPLLGALTLGFLGGRRFGARAQRRVFAGHLPRGVRAHLEDRGARQSARRARAIFHRRIQRVPGHSDRVRRPDDLVVLAPLHAHRGASWAGLARAAAPVSQHVPAVHGDDADCPHHQQHGAAVGRHGGRHPVHRVARDAVSNPREPRSRLEVLHSLRRRHLPSPVRHHSAVFRRREGPRLGGRERAALDASELRSRANSNPPSSAWRSRSCSSATAPRWVLHRCTIGCPMRTRRARRPFRRCCRDCCSMSRCTRSCAAKCSSKARCIRACRAAC